MAIKFRISAICAVVIFLYSCEHRNAKRAVINNWTMDSCGCKHQRSKLLAKTLIDENRLMRNSKEKFLSIFGSPNQVEQNNDYDILIYYFDSICDENKPSVGSDTSFAKFYFKSGDLTDMAFNIQ
jgi:hypothetical protein